jgi:hypothetical protein
VQARENFSAQGIDVSQGPKMCRKWSVLVCEKESFSWLDGCHGLDVNETTALYDVRFERFVTTFF